MPASPNNSSLATQNNADAITLGQLYVSPPLQRRGIGTHALQTVVERAREDGKPVSLAVVKINPARHFYERHGFHTTHEDQYWFYMRRNAAI
jgi:GNAT superfamily N-acetyltransferase